jgi:GNAT superfamily N-acetyltransferase
VSVRIRAAQAGDLDTLVAFNRALAAETEGLELDADRLREGVRAVLERDVGARYLVAESPSGEVLGALMITTEWSDWRNGTIWWIQSVYVRGEARRQGVFRRLFDEVSAEASGRPDVVGLRLYLHSDNRRARQVYLALGLEETPYDVLARDFVY